MSYFIIAMAIGLAGLVMLALPGLLRGHLGFAGHHIPSGAHAAGHILPGSAQGAAHAGVQTLHPVGAGPHSTQSGNSASNWLSGLIPSPRAIFSLLALYGAFGNALEKAAHLPVIMAALLAVVPAVLIEKMVVKPIWNLIFQSQGDPSSPIEMLLLEDAEAVTPFRNGKGVVSVVRDGRMVQFSAELLPDQNSLPIRVGDRLRVENVDSHREKLMVSINSQPFEKE